MISRLEEFSAASVERTGRHQVVQYRNRILPLVRLSEVLEGADAAPSQADPIQVVVYADQGQPVGLVVDNIIDIVEENLTIHRRRDSGLVAGSAVIQKKVTDLLDVGAVIAASGVIRFDTESGGVLATVEA